MTIAILGAIFGQTKFLYIDYTYAKIQLFSTFPQLAVFRFLSWLYSKSQGYIRYVIRSLFHLFGLNNGNKKISLKNKNLSDIFLTCI